MEVITKRNTRPYAVLLGFVVFSSAVVWGQGPGAVKVKATIRDANGMPVAGDITVVQGTARVRSASYRTDSQGIASIEIDAASRGLVVAKADGYVSQERQLAAGSMQVAALEFVLPRAGQVRGRAVDDAGNGVPGAVLHLSYAGQRRQLVFQQEMGEFRADEQGYFKLPFVARGTPFVIEAAADGWLPAFSPQLTMPGPDMQGVLVSMRGAGGTIRVTVSDGGGRPVAGARVALKASADDAGYSSQEKESRTFYIATNRRASTGADGVFEFAGVPAGRVTLTAGRPGTRPAKAEITLRAGQLIERTIFLP